MEALVPDSSVEAMARWMKLLADETRLKILTILLAERELNVTALCDRLGQSQPVVSHHLGLLRNHGLLACRREGSSNYYSLVNARFAPLKDLGNRFCRGNAKASKKSGGAARRTKNTKRAKGRA